MQLTRFNHYKLKEFSEKIGNTSLLEIPHKIENNGRIYAKLEWENPTGSIKDRPAFSMLKNVLETYSGNPKELHILEYSGGNLGLSLAKQCHLLEINLTLVLSSGSKKSLLEELNSLNVTVELVDKEKGFWGVMDRAIKMSQEDSRYTFLYQHQNDININAHKNGTGKEIIKQLQSLEVSPDAWVAAVGTGGTLRGVFESLKSVNDKLKLHLVIPKELSYGSNEPPNSLPKFAGSGGLGDGRKQRFIEEIENDVHDFWEISYDDCLKKMYDFYITSGIRIGSSAAANLIVAEEVAKSLGESATVVTVFPDQGTKEEWENLIS
ncbi:PLP-dependent cysteine synthase family protein [Pseudalkalibacillus hwajinpoensis]|uniref:Pyridoxal-phosphate dependent enzyme n=1 Tax=Guptibacillus hwajinpoensis TaxID=208199 RepID=A0A4U1MEK2_9BACL|nr:pyridoxal-phosphate dependent enzyme [Pseudalkalibacillus hwajinpoensis]TKD69243.1 pyridoxal-phosphate dependent enzyme [Pseudalkalibacillus hwajinpoensis]